MTSSQGSIVLAVSIGCAALVAVGGLMLGLQTLASAPDPAAQAEAGQIVDGSGESAEAGSGGAPQALVAPISPDDDAVAGDDGASQATDGASGSSVLTLPSPGAEQQVDESAASLVTAAPTTAPTTAAPTSTSAPAPTAPPTTALSSGLNSVELEILRLTNELRANPAGALARQEPMPDCVSNGFYDITIDGGTGHPTAVPALTLNEVVSLQLARDWSIQMDNTNAFEHRSNASAAAIYSQLGVNWSATGENIAWFSGYSDSQAAQIFFEGWRESDTGHYCAMVAGAYTHIGVGYHKGASKSWATQNFYR